MHIFFKSLFVVIVFLTLSLNASAQTDNTQSYRFTDTSQFTKEQLIEFNKLNPEQQNNLLYPPKPSYPESTIDCQEYLSFGGISIDISPTEHNAFPGSELMFSGTVINPFDYPVVEGQIFAKIFYNNDKSVKDEHLNAHRLVDQFIAVDNITLKANEQKPITFRWQVPEFAQSGNYEVVFYYSSAHRYSLTGLTFTNDITGNKVTFHIENNDNKPRVHFDEDAVKLNDKNFFFAQPIPTFTKDEKVTAFMSLVNPRDTAASVEVSYKLYSWDALSADNFKTGETVQIELQPNEIRSFSFDVPTIDNAVSYFVVEMKDQNVKSILDIRFGRDGIEETHNNKLGVATYPLKANTVSTLFACAHSAGENNVKESVLTIALKDSDQNVLHSYTYSNGITSSVLGFKDSFVLAKDLYDFTLTSSVTQAEGKPTEVITLHYNCNEIDPSLCLKKNYLLLIAFSFSGIVMLAGVVFFFIRRRNMKRKNVINTNDTI